MRRVEFKVGDVVEASYPITKRTKLQRGRTYVVKNVTRREGKSYQTLELKGVAGQFDGSSFRLHRTPHVQTENEKPFAMGDKVKTKTPYYAKARRLNPAGPLIVTGTNASPTRQGQFIQLDGSPYFHTATYFTMFQ